MLSEVQTHPNAAFKAPLRTAGAPHGENVHSALKAAAATSKQLSLTLGKRQRDDRDPKAERVVRGDAQRPTVKRVRISDVPSVRTINSSPESPPRISLSPTRPVFAAPTRAPEAPVEPPSAPTPTIDTQGSSDHCSEDEYSDDEDLGPPNWGLRPVALVVQPHSALQTPSAHGLALELHDLAHEPPAFPASQAEPVLEPLACKLPQSSYPGVPVPQHVVWRSSAVFASALSEPCTTSLRPAQWSPAPILDASSNESTDTA
ncbi:hypothetical protein AURDEDRAFT_153626 [Auricularia subglabra TFB-10046 SS5]|nr:hypothetical protein AURDEDRAFT_153626 [Auricularia subglabra TFB-10046 SS5]